MIRLLLLLALTFIGIAGRSQSLPANTCGIVYTYDAAGNRTQRQYACNNTGRVAGPEAIASVVRMPSDTLSDKKPVTVEQVEALYPNPTTGLFTVTFTQALKNASVELLDANGRIVQRHQKSGSKMSFDLSGVPSGLYLIVINENGRRFSQRIIKQ
jgi:hypothetical protein